MEADSRKFRFLLIWKIKHKILTRQFRVFIEQIGPLQESIVWVDETKTVPGRNLIRNVTETSEIEDALGLGVDPLVFGIFVNSNFLFISGPTTPNNSIEIGEFL